MRARICGRRVLRAREEEGSAGVGVRRRRRKRNGVDAHGDDGEAIQVDVGQVRGEYWSRRCAGSFCWRESAWARRLEELLGRLPDDDGGDESSHGGQQEAPHLRAVVVQQVQAWTRWVRGAVERSDSREHDEAETISRGAVQV